jgi:hypothetical protein
MLRKDTLLGSQGLFSPLSSILLSLTVCIGGDDGPARELFRSQSTPFNFRGIR